MAEEDVLAAKLKGYNVLIKFKDGEELLLIVDTINKSDDDSLTRFMDAEAFINEDKDMSFPVANIALCMDTVKYIKKI